MILRKLQNWMLLISVLFLVVAAAMGHMFPDPLGDVFSPKPATKPARSEQQIIVVPEVRERQPEIPEHKVLPLGSAAKRM